MSGRQLAVVAVLLIVATLVSWYMFGLTGTLRVGMCDGFSIHSPNPYCRSAVYWGYALPAFAVSAMVATLAALVVGVRNWWRTKTQLHSAK